MMIRMKLPNREKAYIPEEKLTHYILSETHADGKLKAKLFRKFGFTETNISLLEKSLLNVAYTQELKDIVESIHGIKYVIDGKIKTPNDKILKIRTVWILEPNKNAPRFVTTYPV